MFFKNLQIYRVPAPFPITAAELGERLAAKQFVPGTAMEMTSTGWVPPRASGMMVHEVQGQLHIAVCTEKKLMPASVINRLANEKATQIAEQQGFNPGRKQMREIKEDITNELSGRALSLHNNTNVWLDSINGWLVIDSGSTSRADEVMGLLIKTIGNFRVDWLRTHHSPVAAMTEWLESDEAPDGFTVDQDAELRANVESKPSVRFKNQTLDPKDMKRHIESGKHCVQLAMTWADQVSFVLTENTTIKRIQPLETLKESANTLNTDTREELLDADFLLMTGTLNKMINAIIDSLGGEMLGDPDKQEPLDLKQIPDDQLYDQAVTVVVKQQRASISLVQRHLRIGYNRAARLLEQMEMAGVVGAMMSNGVRDVLQAA